MRVIVNSFQFVSGRPAARSGKFDGAETPLAILELLPVSSFSCLQCRYSYEQLFLVSRLVSCLVRQAITVLLLLIVPVFRRGLFLGLHHQLTSMKVQQKKAVEDQVSGMLIHIHTQKK
ncbi:hypothetical protein HS088_TW04G00741 [Tripterygium wilfordii]|uniref:Uncharacterized protein n=1 Tax=Tripterygium wilfordii TaxID=458696 RepID=A0A7J7DR72_TRIWF|nr:hypothetical protein HS088_TW04G00741 [Tripterygium wilfordii]